MIDVRNDVLKATDGKQVPWENSSLIGQFFFKPAAPPTIADKSAETASQIEALHNEIAKLQADQGARLTAQQAQLEILQQKLAAETKTADQLAAQNEGTPAPATNRVIAVEPASGASEPAANAAATAPGPEPTSNSTPPETEVATVESNPAEVKTQESAPPSSVPLPEGVTREERAEDIVSKLKEFECYRGAVNGTWGEPSQDALERFNTLAKLDLPLDEPEPATLDALKDWNGAHCAVEAAVPGHKAKSKHQAVRPPVKTYKKAVTPHTYEPKATAAPGPTVHSGGGGGGGDEQQELQRLFPQSAWPGKR